MHRDPKRIHPSLGGAVGQSERDDLAEFKRLARLIRARREARAGDRPRKHILSLKEMSILLDAAIALGGPLGALLELCILTLRRAHELVGLDLEDIDWETGHVRLKHSKHPRGNEFYLSSQARAAIRRIAGSVSNKGQAITAGRGRTLTTQHVRIDRLRSQIALIAPATIPIEWSFILIRNSGCWHLGQAQASVSGIHEMIGRPDPLGSKFDFSYCTVVAEQWAALISKSHACDESAPTE